MLNLFEPLFENKMREVCEAHPDPSHDLLHVQRVVKMAKHLSEAEGAIREIVVPAAYLHDVVYVSKADPMRKEASQLSAAEAKRFLGSIYYPDQYVDSIAHAIEAHSFSADIQAISLEAQIVQDADRLDAMGAIGIARCFAFSGLALRPIYESGDPFAKSRSLNDAANTLDHFYVKLLKLAQKLNTNSAKKEGEKRVKVLLNYLEALQSELDG